MVVFITHLMIWVTRPHVDKLIMLYQPEERREIRNKAGQLVGLQIDPDIAFPSANT